MPSDFSVGPVKFRGQASFEKEMEPLYAVYLETGDSPQQLASPWPVAVIFCLGGSGGLAYLTKNVLMRSKVEFCCIGSTGIPYVVVPALGNASMIAARPD